MNRDPRFALSQEVEAKQTLLDQLRALICWLEVFRKTSSRRLLVRGYLGADNTPETRLPGFEP